jgi:Ca2+-binding EF-hand superfamily protein
MNWSFECRRIAPGSAFNEQRVEIIIKVGLKTEFNFMRKRTLIALTGVLVAAGVAVAVSAPGPRGHRGDGWDSNDQLDGGDIHGRRGWFGPRSITADEYDAQTRERFARLDKNSDGILDAAEIEAAMKERISGRHGRKDDARPQGGPAGRAEGFLRMFGDKDGKVTKDAFLAEAKRRFTQMDLNNDGKITDDDLPPMMRGKGMLKANGPTDMGRMGPQMGPMGRMLGDLRQADTKNDGVITLDAYLAQQTTRFEEFDRNKDGIVNAADFELMRKEMSDYQIKRFLHAYGAGAQGKITKDQFYAVAKERFARLDRKGEGKITFDRPGWGGDRHRRPQHGGDQAPGSDRGPGHGLDRAPPPKN